MNPVKLMWLFLVLVVSGCAGAGANPPSDEVKAFFATAQEANFRGVTCMSTHQEDLSAYNSFLGIQYPPTAVVEVLSQPPSRPYQAFARLQDPASVSAAGDAETVARLTAKARSIGADAIIFCQPPPGVPVEAVVIKYRKENPAEKPSRP